MINIFSRQTNSHINEFENWLNDFCISLNDLIILDIVNEAYNKGIKVLGDNSCRILKSNDSHLVCPIKVGNYIRTLQSNFSLEEINTIKKSIKKTNKKLNLIIRGHFLTNAIMNYIKKKVKKVSNRKVSFSKDNLYDQLIAQFPNTISSSIDIKHLGKSIKTVMN